MFLNVDVCFKLLNMFWATQWKSVKVDPKCQGSPRTTQIWGQDFPTPSLRGSEISQFNGGVDLLRQECIYIATRQKIESTIRRATVPFEKILCFSIHHTSGIFRVYIEQKLSQHSYN